MKDRFETFTSLILQINRSIQRIKSQEMARFGLRGIHAVCLYYLGREPGGLTQAELAKLCQEDRASVCRALNELYARGMVVDTQPGMAKKYNATLALTPAGREAAEAVREKVDGALSVGAQGIREDEREAFYRQLSTVNENLRRYAARAACPEQQKEGPGHGR